MSEMKFNARRLGMAPLLALGLWATPMAFAQQQPIDCSGVTDLIQRAQCDCFKGQQNYAQQTSAIVSQQAQNDDYLKNVEQRQPGQNSTLGVPGVAQSCNGMTKSAFDSILSQGGSIFGFDIGSLLGPLANSAESTICQSINNAIMSRTSIACPRVSIPGFPINCNASLGVNSNGVQINSNGQMGGWNTSGNANTGVNGTTTANGNYNMGAANRGSGNTTVTAGQAAPQSTGILSNVTNNVSCWINGNC